MTVPFDFSLVVLFPTMQEHDPPFERQSNAAHASASEPPRTPLPPRPRRPPPPPLDQTDRRPPREYLSIDRAADALGLTPTALRARCRRNSRRIASRIEADLGGGIVAIKLGRSWRLLFPVP